MNSLWLRPLLVYGDRLTEAGLVHSFEDEVWENIVLGQAYDVLLAWEINLTFGA